MFLYISIFFFLAVFSYTFYSAIRISITFAPDFSIFYHSARDLLHHISPYTDRHLFTAFNYPIVTALLFIPISVLPYVASQTIFIFLSVASVFGIVYLCFLCTRTRLVLPFFLLAVALVFLSFPTKFTLGMGQTNLIGYFLLLLGFYFSLKKRDALAILTLCIAIFLKPVLALILIVLLFERRWKTFFWTIAVTGFVCISIPYLFHQPNANASFLNQLSHQSLLGREVYYNQGFLGFISRFTPNLQARFFINLVGSAILFLTTLWKMIGQKFVQRISLLCTFLVIVDPLSWQHHFIFLILPFFLTYLSLRRMKNKNVLTIVLLVSYTLVSWNIRQPDMLSHFPLSLSLSNQFYGAFILYLLGQYVL